TPVLLFGVLRALSPNFVRYFTLSFYRCPHHRVLLSFPTRRSSDLKQKPMAATRWVSTLSVCLSNSSSEACARLRISGRSARSGRSEEHTSELQSRENLVCRLLLEKKKDT